MQRYRHPWSLTSKQIDGALQGRTHFVATRREADHLILALGPATLTGGKTYTPPRTRDPDRRKRRAPRFEPATFWLSEPEQGVQQGTQPAGYGNRNKMGEVLALRRLLISSLGGNVDYGKFGGSLGRDSDALPLEVEVQNAPRRLLFCCVAGPRYHY